MTVLSKSYARFDFNEKEILRYANGNSNDETIALLKECVALVGDKLSCRVCYCELPINVTDQICDFGVFSFRSLDLAKNLKNCKKVVVFAATIGVELDRLIAKYSRVSPSKALMLQAIGAERIEALCDGFCNDFSKQNNVSLAPRFSPGYGDLPLSAQKEIFNLLNPSKVIGLSLSDSLQMSPSKSVTAFMGIKK